jgi:hypothetical protein
MNSEKFFEYYNSVRRTMPYRSREPFRDSYFGSEIARHFGEDTKLVFTNSLQSEISVYRFPSIRYLVWDQGQLDLFERLNYFVTCLPRDAGTKCVRVLILKYMLAQFEARGFPYLAGWHLNKLVEEGVPDGYDNIALNQGQQIFLSTANQIQSLFCFGHELGHLLSADGHEALQGYDKLAAETISMIDAGEEPATGGSTWSTAIASGLFLGDPNAYRDAERNRELGAI